MEIPHQIGRPQTDPAGIPAEPLLGAGAPRKGFASSPSLKVTTASAGIGIADGLMGIAPSALESALRRDDDLGIFVNRVLGSEPHAKGAEAKEQAGEQRTENAT